MFKVLQLAFTFKTPEEINTPACVLGWFLCASSICEIIQRTLAEFHWISIPQQASILRHFESFRQATLNSISHPISLRGKHNIQRTFSLHFWTSFMNPPFVLSANRDWKTISGKLKRTAPSPPSKGALSSSV